MRWVLFTVLICLCNFCQSQKNKEYFIAYNADWSIAPKIDVAKYFMHCIIEDDTTYTCRYYNKFGPMLRLETYKDPDLEMPHGFFAWYDTKGKLDSSGFVFNKRKDSYWKVYNKDSNRVAVQSLYHRGKLIERVDYVNRKITKADGSIEEMDKKEKDSVRIIPDSLSIPASYKKGNNSWSKYLSENMKTPDRYVNLCKYGSCKATVVVFFSIDKFGSVCDIIISESKEWSVDMEAIRVLKNSPKWTPAQQFGKPVKFLHKQALTFSVEPETEENNE